MLVGQVNYTTYGEQLGSSVSNFGFAGEWKDKNTGYIYLRARWYDSKTASFISLDPAVQISNESYGYVNGNPLMRIDPSGLFIMTMPNPLKAITAMKKDIIDPLANKVKNGIEKSKQTINTVNKVIGNTIKKGAETVGKAVSLATETIVNAGVTAAKNAGGWVSDATRNTLKFLDENAGDISAGLAIVAYWTAPMPLLSGTLGVLAIGFGAYAVIRGVNKCFNNDCNVGVLALDTVGLASGTLGAVFRIGAKAAGGVGKAAHFTQRAENMDAAGFIVSFAGLSVSGVGKAMKLAHDKEMKLACGK